MKRLKNVERLEGRYLKLKKELMYKIDILDKRSEVMGISDYKDLKNLKWSEI